jgi:hypothetical protein
MNTVPFIKKKGLNIKGKNTSNRTLEISESLSRYQIMLKIGLSWVEVKRVLLYL